MDYFWSFDVKLAENVDWLFTINHLWLVLLVASIISIAFCVFRAKTEKGQKIAKIVLATLLLCLEIGRMIYAICAHKYNHAGSMQGFDWWWTISFQMCAIMTWTTIITLFLSAFVKKGTRFMEYLYHVLFGCAMIGGILTFIYPDLVTENLPILHFKNIQTILVHALLIFVPLYLLRIKEYSLSFKHAWMPLVGYIYIGSLGMATSIVSGHNFAYTLECDLMTEVGLNIPFPWHLPLLLAIVYGVALLLYAIVAGVRALRKRKTQEMVEKKKPSYSNVMYGVGMAFAITMGTLVLLLIGNALNHRFDIIATGAKTSLGWLCLFGFVYTLAGVISVEFAVRLCNNMQKEPKWKHIVLTIMLCVFAFPAGVMYAKQVFSK